VKPVRHRRIDRSESRIAAWRASFAVTTLVLTLSSISNGAIIAEIARVGYPTSSGAAIRAWSWMPVVVDLRLEGEAQFNGYLRLRQFDRDGDAYIDIAPVHLVAETGPQQRYTLYTVANPAGGRGGEIRVELLRSEDPDTDVGELVRVISSGREATFLELPIEPLVIPDDQFVLLYISDRTIGKIRYLVDYEKADSLDRTVYLTHVSPYDLPSQWIGLQMLDAVVWDQADATQLTIQQQQALADWVSHGGTLMMAAARTSDTLTQSKILSPLLPVNVGPVQSTNQLGDVLQTLLAVRTVGDKPPTLKEPIAVAKCALIDDPTVRMIQHESAIDSALIASRRVGTGRCVFVAADLYDLLRETTDPFAGFQFFKQTLQLRRDEVPDLMTTRTPLFRYFESETAFSKSGALFLTVAMLFTVTYVLGSTLGAWRVLQMRNMLKHSWTTLGVAAAAASVISIIGVQAFHGVGRRLHQFSVVDAVAGGVDAWGTAYFGVTTGTFSRIDLWLPQDSLLDEAPEATACFLQPMGTAAQLTSAEASFTDTAMYTLRPSEAVLEDVSIRATLKQFEGRWSGTLRSTITASLKTGERAMPVDETGEMKDEFIVLPDSWIQNGLDHALEDCYLIISERDAFEGDRVNRRASNSEPGLAIAQAIPLGNLEPGERVELYKRLYLDATGAVAPYEGNRGYPSRREWALHTAHKRWASPFEKISWDEQDRSVSRRTPANTQSALLLLTTIGDLDPNIFSVAFDMLPRLSRARCRQFDLSDALTERTAIFVGFCDAPGPVRLAARGGNDEYEVLKPEDGHAMTAYRFLIPIE